MQFFRNLCLITLAVGSISSAEDDYDIREENNPRDLGTDETDFSGESSRLQHLDESASLRQKKSLRFHRPLFLRSGEAQKIARQKLAMKEQEEVYPENVEVPNGLREIATQDEANVEQRDNPQNFDLGQGSVEKQADGQPHSKVQESLTSILNAIHKRQIDSHTGSQGLNRKSPRSILSSSQAEMDAEVENDAEMNDDADDAEDLVRNRKVSSKERAQSNLLDAKIRDLTNQIHSLGDPRSRLVSEKSDLDLLHDIIDKAGKVGNKRVRSAGTTPGNESSSDTDETKPPAKKKSAVYAKETSRESSKEDVPLDSDLERMIQEAAEKIGLWVNQNFDTAKKVTKSKLKGDSVKKEHTKCGCEDTENAKPLAGGGEAQKRKCLDTEAKKAALKILMHAATAAPETEVSGGMDANEEDAAGVEEPKRKEERKKTKLTLNEVKKFRMTTLPPCMTSRSAECTKCKTAAIKTTPKKTTAAIEPKVLEDLCKSVTLRTTCTTTKPCNLSTTEATRKVKTRQRKGPTAEPCDSFVHDKLFKIMNETNKENTTKLEMANLADLIRMLVSSAEAASNSSAKNGETPWSHLEELMFFNKSTPECASARLDPTKLKDLTPEHVLKNANSRLLKHFVNLATLDPAKKHFGADKRPAAQEKHTTGQDKQSQDKQAATEDRQSSKEDRQSATQDRQTATQDRQTAVHDRQTAVQDRQSAMQDRQTATQDRQTAVQDRQTAMQDRQAAVQDRQTAVQYRQPAVQDKQDSTMSPLRALTGLLDLMRKQSEPVASQKGLTEDKTVAERLRLPQGENGTVALNVFIKAAIIPEFKNSSRHSRIHSQDKSSLQSTRGDSSGSKSVDPVGPRGRFTDNTLNNLLKSIIVKARFDRQIGPEMLKAFADRSHR